MFGFMSSSALNPCLVEVNSGHRSRYNKKLEIYRLFPFEPGFVEKSNRHLTKLTAFDRLGTRAVY